MPVSLGDTITVLSADITAAQATPITIEWSQDFRTKTEKFIKTTFTIAATKDAASKTGPDTAGVIFIQADKLQTFEAMQVEGKDQFTVAIDDTFQYGQKSKDGTGRWLAFQNEDHKIYQHRFIQGAIAEGGDTLEQTAKQLGYDSVDDLLGGVEGWVGDYLHNFS